MHRPLRQGEAQLVTDCRRWIRAIAMTGTPFHDALVESYIFCLTTRQSPVELSNCRPLIEKGEPVLSSTIVPWPANRWVGRAAD